MRHDGVRRNTHEIIDGLSANEAASLDQGSQNHAHVQFREFAVNTRDAPVDGLLVLTTERMPLVGGCSR
jgi:hypothetical protein